MPPLPLTSAPCRMLLLALFFVSEFYSSQIGLVCVSLSQTPVRKTSMIDSKTESSEEGGPDNSYSICFKKPCRSYHCSALCWQLKMFPFDSYIWPLPSDKSLDCYLGSLKWVLPSPFHFLFCFGLFCLYPLSLFCS